MLPSLLSVKALGMHAILGRHIFVQSSASAKRWEQPECSSVDEQINMEYYSALKMSKILTRATPWMNLEDITLR